MLEDLLKLRVFRLLNVALFRPYILSKEFSVIVNISKYFRFRSDRSIFSNAFSLIMIFFNPKNLVNILNPSIFRLFSKIS